MEPRHDRPDPSDRSDRPDRPGRPDRPERADRHDTMRAMAADRFGDPAELRLQSVPIPEVDPHEVLLRLEVAGVGEWDPFELAGGYAGMTGAEPSFPYVPGSEGAGEVVAVGDAVGADGAAGADLAHRVRLGDRVFASGFLNPKGGFYADYAAVDADMVAPIPAGLTTEQAAVFGGVALTALRGLDDTLELKPGEAVVVVGASGGVGHQAVQLARRMGARVLAIASGADGVALAERLGADAVVDGRLPGSPAALDAAVAALAPGGVDAALLTAGGEVAERAIAAVRDGGRVAYPTGVQVDASSIEGGGVRGVGGAGGGVDLRVYNADPDPELLRRLLRTIGDEPLHVEVHRTFPLDAAVEALRALPEHHLGKLALRIR